MASLSLEAQMQRVSEKIDYAIKAVVAELVVTTFNRIKVNVENAGGGYGSPVYTGRYYASHKITFGYLDLTTKPETNIPGTYSELQDFSKDEFISRFQIGEPVFISNAVPYAGLIESGEASQKTPEGVYAISLTSAQAYFVASGRKKISAMVNSKFPPVAPT